jgi:uncharacterized cysteine cluster protein YcgN (CxxCxxCC family)
VTAPFWKTKTLAEMSESEWESLCDGCGKCCLHKLEDEDTGRVHLTMVACRLLDVDSCRCSNYAQRFEEVPACVHVRPSLVASLTLPASCAYRLVAEGRDLLPWHPLRSGRPDSVHAARASVRSWAVSEREVADDEWEDYVIAVEDEPQR